MRVSSCHVIFIIFCNTADSQGNANKGGGGIGLGWWHSQAFSNCVWVQCSSRPYNYIYQCKLRRNSKVSRALEIELQG
jgi:hypothetical protein